MGYERNPKTGRVAEDRAAGAGRGGAIGKRSLSEGDGVGEGAAVQARALPRIDLAQKSAAGEGRAEPTLPRLDLRPAGKGEGDAPATSGGSDAKPAATAKGAGKGATKPVVKHKAQDKAPGGASAARTTVGVGELVVFSSNVEGTWTASAIATGSANTATGDEFFWTAMDTKGTAKITFDSGQKGVSPTHITMQVIAPTVDYLHKRKAAFPGEAKGVMGAAMDTDVTFLPKSVSFASTSWWEEPGDASNATGYFKTQTLPHHDPNPQDVQIDDTNSGITDTAGWWGFTGPFKKKGEYNGGSFEWAIPTYYRVLDGDRHLITTVHQRCTITGNGTMTVTKGSSSITRAP